MTFDEIYTRTPAGCGFLDDPARPMSPAMRRMLAAVDGRRRVREIAGMFGKLDERDLEEWFELLRQDGLIEPLNETVLLPPGGPRRAEPVARDAGFDELARHVERWATQHRDAIRSTPGRDLKHTTRMAITQTIEGMAGMTSSGFLVTADLAAMAELNAASAAPAPPRPRYALLFEDAARDAASLKAHLGAAGMKLTLTRSRRQLCDVINIGVRADLIILRVGTREVDALRALECLGRHRELRRIPVILMTDEPRRTEVAKSILLGCGAWLVEPFTAPAVGAAIASALGNGRRPSRPRHGH
jgi:CheY-like chemotaxis protein